MKKEIREVSSFSYSDTMRSIIVWEIMGISDKLYDEGMNYEADVLKECVSAIETYWKPSKKGQPQRRGTTMG